MYRTIRQCLKLLYKGIPAFGNLVIMKIVGLEISFLTEKIQLGELVSTECECWLEYESNSAMQAAGNDV